MAELILFLGFFTLFFLITYFIGSIIFKGKKS